MVNDFPAYWNAPSQLLTLDGCCGPVTAWGILKYFRIRASSARIIEACRYTKRHGTFTIALAVALREFGLSVSFYSDFDPNPNRIERRCLCIAERLGVHVKRSIGLKSLLARINSRSIPVVLYNTPEGNGHLSPLLGVENGCVALPYSDEVMMPKRVFLRRWSEPGVLRQCLIASYQNRT